MGRLRHESDHAYHRAEERRITESERKKVLQRPDKVKHDGNNRIHIDNTTRDKVSIVCIVAVGLGTAILSKNPIFGLSAGTFCTIVTYYLQRK